MKLLQLCWIGGLCARVYMATPHEEVIYGRVPIHSGINGAQRMVDGLRLDKTVFAKCSIYIFVVPVDNISSLQMYNRIIGWQNDWKHVSCLCVPTFLTHFQQFFPYSHVVLLVWSLKTTMTGCKLLALTERKMCANYLDLVDICMLNLICNIYGKIEARDSR